MDKAENQLVGQININKFPADTTKFYELDESQDWLKGLLVELNEKVDDLNEEQKLEKTDIISDLEITKKFKQEYGDYLLVKGTVKANYLAQCVRTLEATEESVEVEIKAGFLAGHLEKAEEFRDVMEIYDTEDMYELYYFQKGSADIYEMVHEQIFLNINQYPIKDADAPLPDSGTKH